MHQLTLTIFTVPCMISLRSPNNANAAGSAALSRLKVVLAHDRTGLDELTMEKIRTEIQDVVAKYCVIQEDDVRFDLYNDDKMTLVSATFPLRGTLGREAGGVAFEVAAAAPSEPEPAAELEVGP